MIASQDFFPEFADKEFEIFVNYKTCGHKSTFSETLKGEKSPYHCPTCKKKSLRMDFMCMNSWILSSVKEKLPDYEPYFVKLLNTKYDDKTFEKIKVWKSNDHYSDDYFVSTVACY